MACGVQELSKRQGNFMTRHGSRCIGIQPSLSHAAIGRITHHGSKNAWRNERRQRPHVCTQHMDTMPQAILHDILLGKRHHFRLQFNPNETRLRKTASEKQGNDPTPRTHIEQQRVSGPNRRDEIGQEKGVESKPVAMLRLVQRQLPRAWHIR